MRIIGDDGKPEIMTINERKMDEQGIERILNDVTIGEFDIVMDTGPGYNSKRQESFEAMMALFQAEPSLVQVAGDLLVRNMDFPGADIIADRLAASNPMAQIDDKSPIPPQAQMQLKQSQATIQQLQQQIQSMQMDMKYGASVAEQQEQAITAREQMKLEAKLEDSKMRTDTQAHDTVIKTETQKEIEAMKAQLALILANMNRTSAKEAEAEAVERGI